LSFIPHIPEDLIWTYPHLDNELKERIIKEFKLHPVLAQILISRGFKSCEEIHDFLYAKLPDLHDPLLMAEMPQAVERVCRAIRDKENILITINHQLCRLEQFGNSFFRNNPANLNNDVLIVRDTKLFPKCFSSLMISVYSR